MDICRLCLCEEVQSKLCSVNNNKNHENLKNKIEKFISINIVEDNVVPSKVCVNCIEIIIQWEIFYEACHNNNATLLHSHKNKVKCEDHANIDDSDDENSDNKCFSNAAVHLKTELNECKVSESNDSSDSDSCDEFADELCEANIKLQYCDNTYTCDICSTKFVSCEEYLDHQESHNGNPVFKCDKCEEIFSTRKDLLYHDQNHRSPCPQCGKLILKSSMKSHLVKHTDKHVCVQCSRSFNCKGTLDQHYVAIHTKVKDQICEICGKRFSTQTAMKVHMKSHSNERLYPCKLCSYAGRTASALYIHMSTHSTSLCICQVCSKTFKSNRNLYDHLRRVHSKIKRHQCNYCDKKFVDKYMLKVHLRYHTGLRPYQCKLCDKSFIRSDGLKEHMATHGERAAYYCGECGKKFACRRSITRHSCTISTQ